ncbi:GNAT family N-acetyltransferase [Candidatus Saganbacteria bacterium]|nr:GNAT family N-acetyltransferase [Candidatus Saganbacteria bacterium]
MEKHFSPSVFLSGDLVYLRTPDIEKDVISGKWHAWLNDKATTRYVLQGIYPNTIEKQIEFVSSAENDKSKMLLCIIDKSNNKHIGVISFSDIDLLNRKAAIAILMGDDSYPPGAPLEAIALMIEHGFDRLNLNKIYSAQVAELCKWSNLAELVGFRIEGYVESAMIRNGRQYDAICLGVTAERFYALKRERGGDIRSNNIEELINKRRKDNLAVLIKDYIASLYK